MLAWALPAMPALGDDSIPTVQGEGSASKTGAGQFTVQLPDGSECAATFSGGKISLFGQSTTKTTAICKNGDTSQTVRAVVSRRLNGTPREVTLTFNDGTKMVVVIPRQAAATLTREEARSLGVHQNEPDPLPLPDLDPTAGDDTDQAPMLDLGSE
jgi:hypothetical protein